MTLAWVGSAAVRLSSFSATVNPASEIWSLALAVLGIASAAAAIIIASGR